MVGRDCRKTLSESLGATQKLQTLRAQLCSVNLKRRQSDSESLLHSGRKRTSMEFCGGGRDIVGLDKGTPDKTDWVVTFLSIWRHMKAYGSRNWAKKWRIRMIIKSWRVTFSYSFPKNSLSNLTNWVIKECYRHRLPLLKRTYPTTVLGPNFITEIMHVWLCVENKTFLCRWFWVIQSWFVVILVLILFLPCSEEREGIRLSYRLWIGFEWRLLLALCRSPEISRWRESALINVNRSRLTRSHTIQFNRVRQSTID